KADSTSLRNLIDTLSTEAVAKAYRTNDRLRYRVLSHLIETVTGASFTSVFQKKIANRFNLNRTTLSNTINSNNSEALSYRYKNGKWHLVHSKSVKDLLGAGAIISTPKELAHFFSALFSTSHNSQQR